MNQENQEKQIEEFRRKRRKRKKIRRVLNIAVPAVLLVCFVVFGILFLHDYHEYKIAKDAYKKLDSFVQEKKETASAKSVSAPVVRTPEASAEETVEEVTFDYPDLDIDFAALEHVNPDFVGVLYIPSLDLRYPVVHSRDNEEYLHKTFDGIANSSGAIFLDYLANKNMEDKNTFIFGHNMRNGSMFGALKKFTQDDNLAANDPYVYFYTSDCVRKYEIFAYYFSFVGSDAYQNFAGDNGYDEYVRKAKTNTLFINNEVDLSGRPNILSLSTCSGTEHVRRLLIHSALIGKAMR
ncbi:MAG: class B sortase [Lachnospiraceae bacterium]|nr:class B sortase [Lachnospiraceae bacterium]